MKAELLYPEIVDINPINISCTRKIISYEDIVSSDPEQSVCDDSDAEFDPETEIITPSEYVQQVLAYMEATQKSFIKLNVGGVIFNTSFKTLSNSPESVLPKLEKSDVTITNNTIFIDRSGKHFEYLLIFLRNGCKISKSLYIQQI